MRAVLRTLDDEVGRGEVGGQGACVAQGGDGLFDQAAELGFHGGLRSGQAAHFTRLACRRVRRPRVAFTQAASAAQGPSHPTRSEERRVGNKRLARWWQWK